MGYSYPKIMVWKNVVSPANSNGWRTKLTWRSDEPSPWIGLGWSYSGLKVNDIYPVKIVSNIYVCVYIDSIHMYKDIYIYVCSYWVNAGQITNFQGLISIWKPFFSSGLICEGVLKFFIRRCLAVTKSTGAFEEYLAWLITMITYLDVHPT